MKEHNEFDELARRKLEEREFPFQEAHWSEMEKILDARAAGRRGWYRSWALPILAVLIGAGIWIMRTDDVQQQELAATSQEERSSTISPGSTQGENVQEGTDEAPAQPETELVEPVAMPESMIGTANEDGEPLARTEHPTLERADAAPTSNEPESGSVEQTASSSLIPGNDTGWMSDEYDRSTAQNDVTTSDTDAATGSDVTASEFSGTITSTESDALQVMDAEVHSELSTAPDPQQPEATIPSTPISDHSTSDGSEDLGHNTQSAQGTGDPDPAGELLISNETGGTDPSETSTAAPTDAAHAPEDGPRTTDSADTSDPEAPVLIAQEAVPALEPTYFAPSDTLVSPMDVIMSDEPIHDTIMPAAPLPAAPPLVDPQSPMELTMFAGVFQTHSSYGGARSETWGTSTEGERTYGAGIEMMRMGRNFGIGGGLHYSSYVERISSEDRFRTDASDRDFYFLNPVDTSFLFITDSVIVDGNVEYIGQTVNTTIMVLDQGVETIYDTRQLREARNRVNRTNYLEIPLLLDMHVVQGRWALGLRGGPTVGLLSYRRGILPNSGQDGYQDLADQEFRSIVLGYTARAYIRHRFNAGWSVGVEPMIRGHLMNGLEADDLTRRPSAFGGVISLNYRFR